MIARTAREAGGRAAGSIDRLVARWALRMADRGRANTLDAPARAVALQQILNTYEAAFERPRAETFPRPPAPEVTVRAQGTLRRRAVTDLTWSSAYIPFERETGARYLACPFNRTATARVFSTPGRPRPTVIFLHGYLGGPHPIEQRLWPVRRLLDQGLDVALCVLPHHGSRRRRALRRPAFPDTDPRLTIEGFGHAVHDVRSLISWLEAKGAPTFGVMGMSLGGYTAALLATIDDRLDFAVPLVPLTSVADFARERGLLVGDQSDKLLQHVLLERLYRVVSPLHAPPIIPPDGRLVLTASHDHICPPGHAERLAEHWSAPLVRFYGSHVLQFGRGRGLRAFGALLERRGWV